MAHCHHRGHRFGECHYAVSGLLCGLLELGFRDVSEELSETIEQSLSLFSVLAVGVRGDRIDPFKLAIKVGAGQEGGTRSHIGTRSFSGSG